MMNLFLIPVLIASILSTFIAFSIDTEDNDDVNSIKTGLITGSYVLALIVAVLLNLFALFTL